MTYLNPDTKIATHAALSQSVHGVGANDIADVADISTHAAVATNVHGTGASNAVVGDDEISGFESIRYNGLLNAFDISMLKTWSVHNMLDGVRDVFTDDTGILSGGYVSGDILYNIGTFDSLVTDMGGIPAQAIDNNGGTFLDPSDATNWLNKYVTLGVESSAKINEIVIQTRNTQTVDATFEVYGSNVVDSGFVLLDTISVLAANKDVLTGYSITNATSYLFYKLICLTSVTAGDLDVSRFNSDAGIVISESVTAESQPTNIHAAILADDAAITLNTDLKFYASVDDGATWEQVTLSDSGYYSSTEKILTGSVAVAGTGTTIKYKIECTEVNFEFYAVGLLWD